MTDTFPALTDLTALDAALGQSHGGPILLFKHSATCGISAQAHHDLAEWHTRHASPVPTFLIHVRRDREVSNAVTDRFRIRHESPQVLLVENGTVRWHGSHWHVNGREVQQAVERLAATTQ